MSSTKTVVLTIYILVHHQRIMSTQQVAPHSPTLVLTRHSRQAFNVSKNCYYLTALLSSYFLSRNYMLVSRLKQKYLWMLCASAVPVSVQAAPSYPPVCRVPITSDASQLITQTPAKDAVYLEADGGEINRTGISTLSGSVIIQQNQQAINADKASYDGRTGNVNASGDVKLSANNTDFSSESINYNLKQQTGTINNATYQVKNSHTHGTSKKINKPNLDEIQLEEATYSTCSIVEPSWHISSSNIVLNNETQTGLAKGVTLRVADVPIFYFPWLSFSLNDERKSGFLSPKVGISDQSGYEITVPYYLNLAPNYDLTTSTSIYSERGLKLENEFRFKTSKSEGTLEYDFFPEDRQYDDQWRDYFNFEFEYKLSDRSKFTIQAEGVSDDDYFADSSDNLISSSTSALEREIAYTREGENWDFSLSALDYQVLDTSSSTYAKLPEVKYSYQKPHTKDGIDLSFSSEATYFDSSNDTTGLRFDLGVKASKRLGTEAWYIQPMLEYSATQYSLEDNDGDNTISRYVPTITLDSGLVFERTLKNQLTQTLEPRLFYTYTPFRDQSDIPNFDTTLTDFTTTNELFRSNRFTGKDRIGDANQLTLAVTSRIQDKQSGQEKLKVTAGQIFYFDDRQVTLDDESAATSNQSDFALELKQRVNDQTSIAATVLWDTEENDWSSKEVRANYFDEKKRLFNLSYQHLDNEVSEVDASFSIPFADKWSVLGRADYDLFNDRSLEWLAGVEYKDCCWGTRVVARRYLTSDNETYDDALYFEVELKGLGSAGNDATSILQEKTYGYDENN
ncbi:LPS-assembly protein LptD [Leucothrix sargassi]|nr:LPS-assembly protein LptD [Leucothrix sargassi]